MSVVSTSDRLYVPGNQRVAKDQSLCADAGSFRDPRGVVFHSGSRILRHLSPVGASEWDEVVKSRLWRNGLKSGRVVFTEYVQPEDLVPSGGEPQSGIWLEHRRLPWISYPFEWSFGMLRDAALLQLDLLLEGLDDGLVLRDGTPYNVQFQGAQPVLMDVLSLGPYESSRMWPGYRQFCETQLFPLLLAAHRGIDFRPWLRGSLRGISAAECHRLLGWSGVLRGGVLKHVVLQDWLSRQSSVRSSTPSPQLTSHQSPAESRELVRHNVKGLRQLISGLRPPRGRSAWEDYDSQRCHYTDEDRDIKDRFIAASFADRRRDLVWDLGCNTGRFSRIAARSAGCVVAADADSACVDHLYESLKAEGSRTIVPMVVDLSDTTAGVGWRGRERRSMEDRGRPDTVLALAVIHHLVFGEGIPLANALNWLCGLADELVLEFVGPDDPMVRLMSARRTLHHSDYSESAFVKELGRTHRIVRQQSLCGGNRILFHARSDSHEC